MKPLRVAVLCDYPEEGWPSMDLTAEMILKHLERNHSGEVEAVRVCPPYRHRLGRMPIRKAAGTGRNVDRIINRYREYPIYLRSLLRRERFDAFQIIDHSYAQLVHELPTGRTVVTCHDLDTFRCLLRPEVEPRPAWFRALTRRTLRGLQAAGAVTCDSEATRSAVLEHDLIPADRLSVAYLGTHPEFFEGPGEAGEAAADRLVGTVDPQGPPLLLHVGSNIPRKRIDVLIAAFAGIRRAIPGARLIRVGGVLTPEQAAQAGSLGIVDAIEIIPRLTDRHALAALYRRAALVLQTSEAEGFGLPLAEAMASGSPLLASDIPVLREVAGEAAVYRPVGDVAGWIDAALALLNDGAGHSDAWRGRRAAGLARAELFRWDAHVAGLVDLYRRIDGR